MSAPPTAGRTLDEATSKSLLVEYGIPIAAERVVPDASAAAAAARELGGGPVVVKLCGEAIAHKTERGLVRLGVVGDDAVVTAADELLALARPEDGLVEVLVAEMVSGSRELIAGVHRDPQFGPTVMLGVGGILAEAVRDVAFRMVPLTELDAEELLDDLATQRLLGEFRGEPAVDRLEVAAVVMGLARLAEERSDVRSVDVNPLIVVDGRPVAVDALVEVDR